MFFLNFFQGAIVSIICGSGKKGALEAIGLFLGFAIIGTICSFFIKEELRRLRPEVQTIDYQSKYESIDNLKFKDNKQTLSKIENEEEIQSSNLNI